MKYKFVCECTCKVIFLVLFLSFFFLFLRPYASRQRTYSFLPPSVFAEYNCCLCPSPVFFSALPFSLSVELDESLDVAASSSSRCSRSLPKIETFTVACAVRKGAFYCLGVCGLRAALNHRRHHLVLRALRPARAVRPAAWNGISISVIKFLAVSAVHATLLLWGDS